jgi:hypothetical protein
MSFNVDVLVATYLNFVNSIAIAESESVCERGCERYVNCDTC